HPDIAARDLPAHLFSPGYVDAANADVLIEQLVRGVRLESLDGLLEAGPVVVAQLSIDPLRHATAQAGLVKHETGFGIGHALGAREINRNAHRGADTGLLDQRIDRALTRTHRGDDLAPVFDRTARRIEQ